MICEICNAESECYATMFAADPFCDGRCHDLVCHCCLGVPQRDEWGEIYVFEKYEPDLLYKLNDLKELGFEPEEIRRSILAVREAIKKGLSARKRARKGAATRKKKHA